MGRTERTTVVLTSKAQTIKNELAPIFGLKNILSAGLILLKDKSTEEQKRTILDALADDIVSLAQVDTSRKKGKAGRTSSKSG